MCIFKLQVKNNKTEREKKEFPSVCIFVFTNSSVVVLEYSLFI